MWLNRIVVCGFIGLSACATEPASEPTPEQSSVVVYEGARLIVGDTSSVIEDGVIAVDGGTIVGVGRRGELDVPAGATKVDLSGKTVMPTLVNGHAHPGFTRGATYGQENLTRENILNDLNQALYFGVGAVQSQGLEVGTILDEIRAGQEAGTLGGARIRIAGRGIASPKTGPVGPLAGIANEITTEDQARQAVQELAAKKVNLVKIWVDDRGGVAPKLAPNLYRVVIAEAHKHGLLVNAHLYYHADAVALLDAGIDGFAHLVRDKEMDDALVAEIVRRNVTVMPVLGSNERNTYTEVPPWLQEGAPMLQLLKGAIAPPVIERLQKMLDDRNPADLDKLYPASMYNQKVTPRQQYANMQRSVVKLAKANAKLMAGGDNGLELNPLGMAEHRELANFVDAGLTPMQAIVAGTSRAAEYLKLDKMGTLAVGKEADFLVLDANPLDDITNTQRISDIYYRGARLDRDAMGAALRASWSQ